MLPPRRAGFFIQAAALALLLASVTFAVGAPPVIDPVAVLNPSIPTDPPRVPVGKALVIPISASDPEGGPLTFKATSSNPRLPVRVKTGNPILRVHVTYAGDGEAAAPFEGDLDFQLFRDLAPATSRFIAGFAQAGYYDDLTFHRIVEGFVAQGGDPAGTGSGTPPGGSFIGLPFTYENEFHPGLIFAGRGQLAMANSGSRRGQAIGAQIILGDFRATNGSQFFVSFEQLRSPTAAHGVNLDFRHTIFGQLVRGFDLLDKIESVPKVATVPPALPNKPTVAVKMATVTVLPGTSEATLFIGATGVGDATITVTAIDSTGQTGKRTFLVRTLDDTVNDPPVMLPLGPIFAPVGSKPQLQVNPVDLEFDYFLYGIAAAGNGTSPNSFGGATIASTYTADEDAGRQTLALGVTGFNDESRFALPTSAQPFAPFEAYSFQVVELIFGDKAARPEAVTVKGAPGEDLTDALVGKLHDLDAAGTSPDFMAQINWGDGSALSAGTLGRDPAVPGAASYAIIGRHTYARPGIYPIFVTATGNQGTPAIVRSTAVITAGPLVAAGTHSDANGSTLLNRTLATFADANSTRRAADYVATVDWGDGLITRGIVANAPDGSFLVRGTHVYKDAQTYAIAVRIHKNGADAATDALAWSSATLRFVSAPYLPPFPQTHLVAAWNSGPSKEITNPITGSFNPADLMVRFSGNFAVVNSGNRTLAVGKIRYWLSDDAVLDTTGANADTRLKVSGATELTVTGLAPGGGGNGDFIIPLPKGQSGGGKYLLAQLVYSDPIADHSAVEKVVIAGPIDPSLLIFDRVSTVNPSGTRTSESGGQVTFKVALDTAPTAEVKIPVESSLISEGTVAPAELIFTAENWSQPQIVTVTGVDDTANDGDKNFKVTLKTPVTTDENYKGLSPRELSLTNEDNDP